MTRAITTAALLAVCAAPAAAQEAPQRTQPLKIKKVVLYKHGVGYFEREGQVDGDVTIPLHFKTRQMPDVLKSLFAVHTSGRGRIGSIVYDSKDPLAKQLADIMVEVPDGNALTMFLRRLKGAPVELTIGAKPYRGHVMGIEPIHTQSARGRTTRYKVVLLGSDGMIRPLELLDASAIRVLDDGLRGDLKRMMEIYAKSRHADRKVVDINSTGAGPRTLRVGYIVEQPIWKTTYRLIFEPGEKPLLQGWAIVENRTDEDWEDVNLTFVAGSPLSFLMDLYTSYYPQRPVVGVQSAEGAETGATRFRQQLRALAEKKKEMAKGRARGWGGDRALKNAPMAPAPGGGGGLGRMLAASLAPAAAGAEAGELFAYTSKAPVAIKRGQAALVPILLESVDGGERILYYRGDLSRHPQHAFLLKNSSTLTLEKGPVTVFEGATCQGESLLQKVLKPDMTAVLPYAIESAVEVKAEAKVKDQPVTRIRLIRGVLRFERTQLHETVYTLRERAGTKRVVYIDHPRTGGTELAVPAKPAETLPGHYRFRVELDANGTATLTVRETRPQVQQVRVQNMRLDQLRMVIQAPELGSRAKERLEQVAAIMERRTQVAADLAKLEADRQRLTRDQQRIRKTLDAFRNVPAERAMRDQYLQRLVASDEKIDALDQKRESLQKQRAQLDGQLAGALRDFSG